jgi:hypothetical protein
MCSHENYIDRLAFSVNFSNCQFGFPVLEYYLVVKVHLPRFLLHNSHLKLFSIALYCFLGTFYMYSNWNYKNLWGKICRIEKNPIILSFAYTKYYKMHCGVRLHGQNVCYVIFWKIAPQHWI